MSIQGWFKRTRYFQSNPLVYRQYRQILQINQTPGDAFTREKLRQIKAYAIAHTEFYKDYHVDDPFPVMTKLDFIENREHLRSSESFDGPLHVSMTSGSTGTPLVVEQDAVKRSRTIADLKVYGEYARYRSHEKMLQLRAYNGKELDRSVDRRENIWRYDISYLNADNMEDFLSFVQSWKPDIIFGYVSTLETICDYILESEKKYCFSCQSVLVGAEMLSDATAQKIQRVFGCPVFDRYSNMEMGIYAQREYGKTNFIVNKASYYFEVLKMDTDQPAEPHELGRLVFTDLFNHAFPMIRYDTGDLGSYCVRNGEMELETVYGRKVDTIYDCQGRIISPHSITNGMWGVANIHQWQFVQLAQGEYDIRINASGHVDEQDVMTRLKAQLGEQARITVTYLDEIPVLRSQKRKYIVNLMK